MKTRFLTNLLFLITFCLTAEVAVYKLRLTGTSEGAGESKRFTNGGYVVMDILDPAVSWVLAFEDKTYSIQFPTEYIFERITSAKGRAYQSYQENNTYYDILDQACLDSCRLKGSFTLQDIGSLKGKYWIARSLTVSGSALRYDLNGFPIADVYSGSLTLDTRLTQEMNRSFLDLDDSIREVVTVLRSRGYSGSDY